MLSELNPGYQGYRGGLERKYTLRPSRNALDILNKSYSSKGFQEVS